MTDRDALIDAIRERASAPLSKLRGLPSASYTSDELFSLECDRHRVRRARHTGQCRLRPSRSTRTANTAAQSSARQRTSTTRRTLIK